jgi:hypothetical protein
MRKLTIQELIERAKNRKKKISKFNNFDYIRLLREDYPNIAVAESTKAIINRIKKGII